MATPAGAIEVEEAIHAIGEAVGAALSAQCVLLFGSRARGSHKDHSDVDLAVLFDRADSTFEPTERIELEKEGARVAESICGSAFRRIDVRVWTEPEYRAEKRSINHLAGRSWREGRILYGCHETLPGEEVVEELPHVRQLIHMAQGQLTTVTAMRDNKLFREEDFGFHAGRATELTLKAWIALTGNQYQLTHFLDQLLNQLEQAGVPETNQFRDLASLTNYAVIYQYRIIESPVMDRERVVEDVRGLVAYVAALVDRAEAE